MSNGQSFKFIAQYVCIFAVGTYDENYYDEPHCAFDLISSNAFNELTHKTWPVLKIILLVFA